MKTVKIFRLISILCAVMLLLASCQSGSTVDSKEESESIFESTQTESVDETVQETSTEEVIVETTEEKIEFQGRVISCVYEDYYMYWDDIAVLIITYTPHFVGLPVFGLIGYNGRENPVLFCGNTQDNGYGEFDMYCFKDNRVYKSDETIKGMLHYNNVTKEFATLDENGTWNIYTYYSNHIIWLREEVNTPEGFEPITLTPTSCSPPPMVENIRSFIIY